MAGPACGPRHPAPGRRGLALGKFRFAKLLDAVTPDSAPFVPLLFAGLGSSAEEVAQVLRYCDRGRFPSRHGKKELYAVRTLLAAISAALAYGYGAANPILAFHIGAATPLMIQQFARTPPTPKLDP